MLFFFCSLHGKPQRGREKSAVSKAKTCRRVNWWFHTQVPKLTRGSNTTSARWQTDPGQNPGHFLSSWDFPCYNNGCFFPPSSHSFPLFFMAAPSHRAFSKGHYISRRNFTIWKAVGWKCILTSSQISLNCSMLEHEKKNDFLDSLKERSWLKQSV